MAAVKPRLDRQHIRLQELGAVQNVGGESGGGELGTRQIRRALESPAGSGQRVFLRGMAQSDVSLK